MGNPDLGATVADFVAILDSIDYSKFKRSSNLANEISAKLLSSFLDVKCCLQLYDFKFLIKAAERKHRIEYSTRIQEIETIDNRKDPKSFKVTLGIRPAKQTW